LLYNDKYLNHPFSPISVVSKHLRTCKAPMYGLYLKHVHVFFSTGALTSFTLLLKMGISEALARNRFKLGKLLLE